MEYVNINSLQDAVTSIAGEDAQALISRYAADTHPGTVLATDELELLAGREIVQQARKNGKTLVPLRRVGLTRDVQGFPKRILLELTSDCNSFCFMCPRHVLKREWRHMETPLALKVIKELGENGLSGLWLYHIGESLLHPDFFKILGVCRQYLKLGTLWLSTNGEIMNDENRRKIIQEPVDILNYSVNAMTEESYKKITPKLHFDVVQGNLRALIALKKKLGRRKPLVRAQMMDIPFVKGEVEMLIEEFGQGIDILSVNKLELFSQNVTGLSDTRAQAVNAAIPKCNRLERQDFFIVSDGTVTCCDTDFNTEINIGNVNRNTVREIFNGEAYQGLMAGYRAGRLHEKSPCRTCTDFNL
ncbi:MAG: SPASM domain-containing protein [Candidatus Omnitrophica bacterium]|nr:SPASM domain-containing protein [Candidatus Omnitrophota bacterium]